MAKELTARQQEIWDMFRPVDGGGQGKRKAEIAGILGISENVVSKTLTVVRKKLGIKVTNAESQQFKTTEFTKPAATAAVVDAVTDPYANVAAECRKAGLPDSTTKAIIRRLQVKYHGVTTAVRALQTRELSDMIGQKIHLMLGYLDDKVAAEASARDLAMGISQLVEKRQLLRGEPTQIISDHERAKLHELLPAMLAEANRRGVTVDGQVTEKTVSPT